MPELLTSVSGWVDGWQVPTGCSALCRLMGSLLAMAVGAATYMLLQPTLPNQCRVGQLPPLFAAGESAFYVVIPRNTTFPTKKETEFTTTGDNQSSVSSPA
jgi:hypothetical protein